MSLSPEVTAKIDHWISKYPPERKQSAVMGALAAVQDDNGGWLTPELIDEVAKYLEMPAISVQEVATFYGMYEHKPVGKYKIGICTNISCLLCGSDDVVSHLEKKLDIKMGETSEDQRFTLKEVECLGACGGAPMFQINRDYYENLTLDKIDTILDELD